MGKPGAQAMNIFQTQGIKNNPEKGRYSDPQIEGLGSPYNKKGCGSNYKQTSSQTATFGPQGSNPNKEVYDGIVAKSSNKQTAPKNAFERNAVKSEGKGIFSKITDAFKRNAIKGTGKSHKEAEKEVNKKDCGCPKDLETCNCE